MEIKYIVLILNGLSQAAVLFVLGSGLTLAFGLMRVINLSHGAFYMLGGYIGYSVLLVEQNIYVAEALADRIYIMFNGETVYESTADKFLEDTDLHLKYLGV